MNNVSDQDSLYPVPVVSSSPVHAASDGQPPSPPDNIVSACNRLADTCRPGRHGVVFVGVMRVDSEGTWIKNAPLGPGDPDPIFHLMVGICDQDIATLIVRYIVNIPVHCLVVDEATHTVLRQLF